MRISFSYSGLRSPRANSHRSSLNLDNSGAISFEIWARSIPRWPLGVATTHSLAR